MLFAAIAVLAIADITADAREGTTVTHVLIEGSVALTALGGALYGGRRAHALFARSRALELETQALGRDLADARAAAETWRAEAGELMRGLGVAIDRQFDAWELTPAEKETALLLLKGLSLREVGDARDVTEATARQQARSVYRKAGLTGRHDLAAFFLEDLLLPITPSDDADAG